MKKTLIIIAVLVSFLLGNLSMLASVFKLFGEETIKVVLSDKIYQTVTKLLYGDATGSGPSENWVAKHGLINYPEKHQEEVSPFYGSYRTKSR